MSVFCGTGKIPKGKKRGSMKQCAEAGQIRYYGLKKVDPLLVENAVKEKKIKVSEVSKIDEKIYELLRVLVKVGGTIKKRKGQIQAEKNKEKKEKFTKELEPFITKYRKIQDDIRKYKADKEKKTKKGSNK